MMVLRVSMAGQLGFMRFIPAKDGSQGFFQSPRQARREKEPVSQPKDKDGMRIKRIAGPMGSARSFDHPKPEGEIETTIFVDV